MVVPVGAGSEAACVVFVREGTVVIAAPCAREAGAEVVLAAGAEVAPLVVVGGVTAAAVTAAVGTEVAMMGEVVAVDPVVVEVFTTVGGTAGAGEEVIAVAVAADVEAARVGAGPIGSLRRLSRCVPELKGVRRSLRS
jgi:hypothetical protein